MNRFLSAAALAAALCTGGAAHAGLITFNNPGLIDIDNGIASYTEAGFVISGPATSFLPLDDAMTGGFDATAFTLTRVGGGAFGLQSLDVAPFDLGFGAGPGTLFVAGLFGGTQVTTRSVDLASASSLMFDASWANLTSVSFSATGGFSLDNIATVPEPGTFALAGAGLLLLAAARRRR